MNNADDLYFDIDKELNSLCLYVDISKGLDDLCFDVVKEIESLYIYTESLLQEL